MRIDKQSHPHLFSRHLKLLPEHTREGFDVDEQKYKQFLAESSRVTSNMNLEERKSWAAYSALTHPSEHPHPHPPQTIIHRYELPEKRTGLAEIVIVVLLLVLIVLIGLGKAHGQTQGGSVILQGKAKGTTAASQATVTPVDANHNAIDVNITGGGGSGGTASNFGAAFPATGTAIGFTDGLNMQPAKVDGSGNQFVNCAIGCAGSSFADSAAFTIATSNITNVGGTFNDAAAALLAGQAGVFRATANRALHINLRNATGTEIGTASTPVRIDPTGTTAQPVSGTVTANQGGAWSVTANIGTTNGLALDASVTGLQVAQGSTTAGQKGFLDQGAVTTAAPTYTTGQTSPLSLDTTGNLRTSVNNTVTVSVSGTATVSGTVTANQGTANATPWNENVAQFGGAAVSTGTGASGAGIPRVTVANDSSMIGTLADNGVAAATNRFGTLPGIYQTSYLNGVAATQGRNAAVSMGTDGLLWTANLPAIRPASFRASATVSSAASATDIAVMPGNASNTVLLTKIKVSCTQTTAGIIALNLIKRSTADTLGTSAAMTVVQDDSNTAAGASAPLTYTANPTTGTTVGNVDTIKFGCMATGTTSPNDYYILNSQQKPIVLRGTAQQLAVNLGGTTVTGGSFTITFEWIETSTITP